MGGKAGVLAQNILPVFNTKPPLEAFALSLARQLGRVDLPVKKMQFRQDAMV